MVDADRTEREGEPDGDGAVVAATRGRTEAADDGGPEARDHRSCVTQDTVDELAERIKAHEHHHAADLTGFIASVEDTLHELSIGVGGTKDLSWAVRGVRQIRAHLRRLDERTERLAALISVTGGPGGLVAGAGAEPRSPASERDGTGLYPSGRVGQLFDYTGFERTFRGDAEQIQASQIERYGELMAAVEGPVVDVGCGRGEFLQHLAGQGVQVLGVEPDEGMAAAAEAAGVPVRRCTASEYLESVPDGSLGAVISLQVVEHLPFADVLRLVDLAAAKLRPGGLFVAETPNPASWIVMHSSFILDPTHRWPLHPALLAFLCTSAGMEEVEVRYFAEADTLHLPTVESKADPALADQVNRAFAQLNDHLYGPQDYAVVARARPSAATA
jgi:SAM-dependent methyltransferase